MKLEGKKAIVTGGASGIGAASARLLASTLARNASIVAGARQKCSDSSSTGRPAASPSRITVSWLRHGDRHSYGYACGFAPCQRTELPTLARSGFMR